MVGIMSMRVLVCGGRYFGEPPNPATEEEIQRYKGVKT